MELEIKIHVNISLNDEDCGDPIAGDPLAERMAESAREAIVNALEMGEQGGFSHDLATITSVSVLKVGKPARVD